MIPKVATVFLPIIPILVIYCEHVSSSSSYMHNARLNHEDKKAEAFSNHETLCETTNNLETGVCEIKGYQTHHTPSYNTSIFVSIEHQKVHSVDDRSNTFRIDMQIVLYWKDPGIERIFSNAEKEQGYIPLSWSTVRSMWTPELFVSNSSDYKEFVDSQHVTSAKILFKHNLFKNSDTVIEYKVEFSASVYCAFNYSRYPKDNSVCTFSFGSQYGNIKYILLPDTLRNNHYITDKFELKMYRLEEDLVNIMEFKNNVALTIHIQRKLIPFLYRYYFPSILFVVVSSLSIIIPLDVLQARMGINVALLLAMANLYVTQMVKAYLLNIIINR